MSIEVFAEGFDDLEAFFNAAPAAANEAMRMALNDTSDGLAKRKAQEGIEEQVNFPSKYVKDRIGLAKRATNNDLEVIIRGRDRPTSLARFVSGGARSGMRGDIRVRVNAKGGGRTIRKGFIVDLKGQSGDGSNLGLAVRLKPGETMRNTRGAKVFKTDKYGSIALLYGPSIDQVFDQVAGDITPDVERAVTAEFFRQFERLTDA